MPQADPSQRFQSAQEVLAAVQQPSAGQANAPSPNFPTPSPRTPRKILLHRLPLLAYLGHAAFVGAEGGLVGLALYLLSLSTPLSAGIWLISIGILVYLQWQHIIERLDLLVIVIITGGLVALLLKPPLDLLLVAAIGSAFMVVNTAIIFRLVYRLLSRGS